MHTHTHTESYEVWVVARSMQQRTGMSGVLQCNAILIHTGIELRVMLINLTAISTGFWIREDRKRKGAG